jgi:hypothetical protein
MPSAQPLLPFIPNQLEIATDTAFMMNIDVIIGEKNIRNDSKHRARGVTGAEYLLWGCVAD